MVLITKGCSIVRMIIDTIKNKNLFIHSHLNKL
uniref:Uncharacterized protein n=1 Tax=Rhizophora mucronata TaxID=61149 RepID=A0A2P2QVF6_RHIMU